MTPAEFIELAGPLAALEDYLQDQRRAALAVADSWLAWIEADDG